MTYEDDWEIIKNAGKSLAAATVDTTVALVQDVVNISGTLFANSVNNFATGEEWANAFDGFWGKAWSKQGGIEDMLIDLGNSTFEEVFLGGSKNNKNRKNGESKESIKFIKSIISSQNKQADFELEILERDENDTAKFSNRTIEVDLGNPVFSNKTLKLTGISPDFSKDKIEPSKNSPKFSYETIETPNIVVIKKFTLFPKLSIKPNLKKSLLKLQSFKLNSKRNFTANESLNKIYEAGPLLYSNMFDVAFVIRKRHQDVKDEPIGQKNTIIFLKNAIDIEKDVESDVREELFNISNFSVRCANVTIPMASQQTFQQKFLECSIERPNSMVSFENQSSLTIDMDANLYYLDFFQSLAGHRPNYGYISGTKKVWSDTPNEAANLIGNKDYILDVVVTSRSLHSWHPLRYNPTTEAGDWANICYIFQDVKFLGTDKIKFSRDSNAIQSCSFDFIFRSLETLYKNNETVIKPSDSEKENMVYNGRLNITDTGLEKDAMVDSFAGKNIYRK